MAFTYQFQFFKIIVSARIRIISVIYIFILAGIVVLADVGQTQHFLHHSESFAAWR
jgi:hypothetical protein